MYRLRIYTAIHACVEMLIAVGIEWRYSLALRRNSLYGQWYCLLSPSSLQLTSPAVLLQPTQPLYANRAVLNAAQVILGLCPCIWFCPHYYYWVVQRMTVFTK